MDRGVVSAVRAETGPGFGLDRSIKRVLSSELNVSLEEREVPGVRAVGSRVGLGLNVVTTGSRTS